MSGNAVELPYPIRIIRMFLGVLNVIQDLGIRDKILVDVGIVNLEAESDMLGVLDDIILILLDKFNDFGTILVAIGLWWEQKCLTDEGFWVMSGEKFSSQ